MLCCKEATRLMSKALEQPLPWREVLSLRLHQAICTGCRRAEQQFRFLRAACEKWREGRD